MKKIKEIDKQETTKHHKQNKSVSSCLKKGYLFKGGIERVVFL